MDRQRYTVRGTPTDYFRQVHGDVEDWSADDFEHYLEACAETADADSVPVQGQIGGRS